MRHYLPLSVLGCFALFAGNPQPPDLPLIDRLDGLVQQRFQTPLPNTLGMSRVMVPSSFGRHFQPGKIAERDFVPENPDEQEVVARLEEKGVQVGLYLFGAAITVAAPQALDFRALKGPGAVTRGTPRPAWYPSLAPGFPPQPDALPDWNAIYPLAREAMRSFQGGGKGWVGTLGGWNIAARPVVASDQRCVSCHNNQPLRTGPEAKPGEPIGGILYAFRRAQ